MVNAILNGLLTGGMYALIAMGLTLQYGVARIMNLSYGEFLIAAAFASSRRSSPAPPGRGRPAGSATRW
jgi:branched-subunit amino acid ABC-type transport system permease component